MSTEEIVNRRRDVVGRLKRVLLENADLELEPEQISADGGLFALGLGLDSIDALQISVGVETEFDVTIPPGNPHVFFSINTLADFVLAHSEEYAQ